MCSRKSAADYILYQTGLLNELNKIGAPHIIGSYKMDMMAWNDLDIDIENDAMSLDRLYQLSEYIIKTFKPSWYEAKEEKTADGKTVWFHGFETNIAGELWNVDLWFLDNEAIEAAEKYCDDIAEKTSDIQKKQIIKIKQELIERKLYSFDKFTSVDVYSAVIDNGVTSTAEFLNLFGDKNENRNNQSNG